MPWGPVLRQLAQSWASAKVSETVQQAAQDHPTNPQPETSSSSDSNAEENAVAPPNPFANVDVGVVVALNIEAGCFSDRLGVKTNAVSYTHLTLPTICSV